MSRYIGHWSTLDPYHLQCASAWRDGAYELPPTPLPTQWGPQLALLVQTCLCLTPPCWEIYSSHLKCWPCGWIVLGSAKIRNKKQFEKRFSLSLFNSRFLLLIFCHGLLPQKPLVAREPPKSWRSWGGGKLIVDLLVFGSRLTRHWDWRSCPDDLAKGPSQS